METSPSDSLKFNVGRSSRGKPGLAGIGGVLRDSTAVKLLSFKAIGLADLNVAELLAAREAMRLPGWEIVHISRNCNDIVDALANFDLTRQVDLVVFYE